MKSNPEKLAWELEKARNLIKIKVFDGFISEECPAADTEDEGFAAMAFARRVEMFESTLLAAMDMLGAVQDTLEKEALA